MAFINSNFSIVYKPYGKAEKQVCGELVRAGIYYKNHDGRGPPPGAYHLTPRGAGSGGFPFSL